MAVVVAALDTAVGSGHGTGLIVRIVVSVAGGMVVYIGGAGVAGTLRAWQTSRERRRRRYEEAYVRYPGRH
jgi:hypothetical protein